MWIIPKKVDKIIFEWNADTLVRRLKAVSADRSVRAPGLH